MKSLQFAKFLVLALAVTVAASACKKTPVKVTEIPGGGIHGGAKVKGPDNTIGEVPPASIARDNESPIRNPNGDRVGNTPDRTSDGTHLAGSPPNFPVTTSPTNTDTDLSKIPLANPRGTEGWTDAPDILGDKDAVYFDFDSSAVKASEKHKAEPVAEHLKANPNHKIRIYGNCDERGTEEYNRSLGERRALALRTELLGLGVDPERIDTVTNGKDKPKALGHDEASWRINRRGDFVVLVPPPAP